MMLFTRNTLTLRNCLGLDRVDRLWYDNVAITAGTGTSIAADDIGGVLHQRVKISSGADGSAADVSSANPLPVSILSSISMSARAVGGSLSAFQGGSWLVSVATLPVLAEVVNTTLAVTQSGTWDEVGINDSGNSITVDGGVAALGGSLSAFQGGNWLVSVATLPVMANVVNTSLAVTNAGLTELAAAIDTEMQVDVVGSLPAGDNNIGNVDIASIAAGNNNIGDVDAVQSGTWTVQPGNTPNSTAWLVTMATLPVVGDFALSGAVGVAGGSISSWGAGGSISSYVFGGSISAFNAGGSLSSFQGGNWTVQPGNTPNTTAWLVTMATLPVVGTFDVAGQATVTAIQGDSGASAWLMTMATLPVMANVVNTTIAVTQSGTWDEVGIHDSGNSITVDGNVGANGGSVSAFAAGGSLSVFQGGGWNVFSSMASGTNFLAGGQYLPTMASMSSLEQRRVRQDLFGNLMVNTNVPLPNITRLNRFYTLASNASLMASPGAGRRLVIRELDYSVNATVTLKLVEDQGGTPATIWGPHYFPPNGGMTKNDCYIALTANKSLGLTIVGTSDSTIDLRVETENV